MNRYARMTREELIRELELIQAEKTPDSSDPEQTSTDRMLTHMISVRKVLSDVLQLLLTPGDEAIDQALLCLIPFFKADRVYIGSFEEKDRCIDIAHEVTEHEILSYRDDLLRKIPEEQLPWWSRTLKAGKDIVIHDIDRMPEEARQEKELLDMQAIRSLLAVPLFSEGDVCGFIGLDAVKERKCWSPVDIENLHLLADIISVALERSKARKEKENSENRFRVLYQNMPLCYLYKKVVFDENGRPADLEYLDVNPMTEKLFGLPAQACVGNTFRNLFGPHFSSDLLESQLAIAGSQAPLIVERIETYKGKSVKITSYSPYPNHLVTLCTEFSALPQMKETLLRSEAKFKMIFDKLPWGVELYDSDGTLRDINDADLKIFGTTRDQVLGINMFRNPNIPDYVNERLKSGEDISFRLNYDFREVNRARYYSSRVGDEIKHLRVKGIPLKDNNNFIFGYLYIVFDDTENYCKNEQTQDNLAKLQVATDTGESVLWEYDTRTDTLTMDYPINPYSGDNNIAMFLKKHPIRDKASFFSTLHPDDREEVYDRHFMPLLEGKINNYSIMYRRITDDRLLWFMSNVRAYKFNPDGTPSKIVSYVTDITAKMQLQDKLHRIENENKMFGYAVSQSNNEIFAIDTEGRFVFCNRRVMENYDFREPVGAYVLHDINPDYPTEKWYELRSRLRESQSVTFETAHHLKNGQRLPVEVHVYRVEDKQYGELFWCFIRDITHRISQRQKISRLNSLMDTILNNVPVAIVVKNIGEDFRHVYFNRAAETFTGKQAEDVLGKTDFEIFDDRQTARAIRHDDLMAVRNGSHSRYAVEYTTRGETRIINSVRLLVNFPDNDNQPMIIVLLWDITDQRKNEIELVKAKEADKLKSAFLANMSHEIRTPLNAIVGFSSIMADADDPDERHGYQEIINKNNDLLLQLINDILDFSKIEAGIMDYHRTDTDIKEICQEVCQVHSLRMKENVRLIFDEAHLPSVRIRTDMKRVIQVLSNFITNAIKFTREGSISVSYEIRGSELFLSVCDTGIGIAEEYRQIIFDRFVKVNDFKQGTGLGLPISKMIIENLGGRIGVDSEVGKGSTFWFTLPLEETEETEETEQTDRTVSAGTDQDPEQESPAPPSPKTEKQTVLIAEDVEENYLLLRTLLGREFRLYHAWNGQEAVELYRQHRPDLILMDMKMPVMDGFQATEEIRRESMQVPIVALSAFAFETEKQKARMCGITDYLVKPIDIQVLRQTVDRLLKSGQPDTNLRGEKRNCKATSLNDIA